MDKVRVGIVGAGFVSHLHMNAYLRVAGVPIEVVAIADINKEQGEKFAAQYGIKQVYTDYRELLDNKDIDVVDVCVPNILHHRVCIDTAEAGKHIICEKPLTGYFGEDLDVDPMEVGKISRLDMYKGAVKNSQEILDAVARNNVKLCYAEDFVYAPPVLKAKRLLEASGGTILELRSEESHSGSHAKYARYWHQAGGGSLLRLGSHPLGLVIHLKQWEGMMKTGKPIGVRSVMADVANVTHTDVFRKTTGERWLVDEWHDVEDWATVVLTFEDGTKGLVLSNDITLGGIVNTLNIYANNNVIKVDMAANDAIKAYAPTTEVFGDEYISEKVQTKAGWSFPSPDEDWMRGYPQEIQDFMEAVYHDRDPVSNEILGHEVVRVTYAAYLSAEQGKRIDLAELDASLKK